MRSSPFQTIARPPLVPALAALAVWLALPAGASAQEILCDGAGSVPCGFQLQDVQLQKVPAVFKFQARVSQAKLPIGEGEFAKITVRLLRGNTPLCEEELNGVQVRGSVLNLEIGRHMSCEIDEVIADTGASSMKDMGGVMKQVLARAAGRADGGKVSALVKSKLAG